MITTIKELHNSKIIEPATDSSILMNKKSENAKKHKSIEELFRGYNGNYQCNEFYWEEMVGNEECISE